VTIRIVSFSRLTMTRRENGTDNGAPRGIEGALTANPGDSPDTIDQGLRKTLFNEGRSETPME
jgi:hypothetical protein